jgi:cytochrome oxidase Cu insertion factor (SCO1/SenC/PrrC family)
MKVCRSHAAIRITDANYFMTFTGLSKRISAVLLIGVLAAPAAAWAQANAYDKLDKGPKVGAAIPQPFQATDQNGQLRDFASLTGKRGLVLLFSRSLSW